MHISIIIPCFNEAAVLDETYRTLTTYLKSLTGIGYQLIFVNDGSTDKTLSYLESLAAEDARVRYISFSRNFGKESSMLAGLSYADGDAVIIMDADLQHPPSLIEEMIQRYHEGYDQVIAKRTRTGDNVAKTLFSKMYYRLVNQLTDVEMLDGVGDFRLLSRKAVQAILALPEYNRFSKGLFSWIGFKQYMIEYENQARVAGESKWSLSQLLNYGVQGILSFNDKPLRVAIKLGIICLSLSLLYIIWMFIKIMLYGIDVGGYFTTISAILIIGGTQLLSIGILGEYIGKIYYEVKRRPHYIIERHNFEACHNNGNNKENL